MRQIAAQELASQGGLRYIFNFETTKYDVNAIRTVSSNANLCRCKADLHITFDLNDNLKKIRDTDPETYASLISNNYREANVKDIHLDIEYTGQLTDDGKDIYVEVSGLK